MPLGQCEVVGGVDIHRALRRHGVSRYGHAPQAVLRGVSQGFAPPDVDRTIERPDFGRALAGGEAAALADADAAVGLLFDEVEIGVGAAVEHAEHQPRRVRGVGAGEAAVKVFWGTQRRSGLQIDDAGDGLTLRFEIGHEVFDDRKLGGVVARQFRRAQIRHHGACLAGDVRDLWVVGGHIHGADGGVPQRKADAVRDERQAREGQDVLARQPFAAAAGADRGDGGHGFRPGQVG